MGCNKGVNGLMEQRLHTLTIREFIVASRNYRHTCTTASLQD